MSTNVHSYFGVQGGSRPRKNRIMQSRRKRLWYDSSRGPSQIGPFGHSKRDTSILAAAMCVKQWGSDYHQKQAVTGCVLPPKLLHKHHVTHCTLLLSGYFTEALLSTFWTASLCLSGHPVWHPQISQRGLWFNARHAIHLKINGQPSFAGAALRPRWPASLLQDMTKLGLNHAVTALQTDMPQQWDVFRMCTIVPCGFDSDLDDAIPTKRYPPLSPTADEDQTLVRDGARSFIASGYRLRRKPGALWTERRRIYRKSQKGNVKRLFPWHALHNKAPWVREVYQYLRQHPLLRQMDAGNVPVLAWHFGSFVVVFWKDHILITSMPLRLIRRPSDTTSTHWSILLVGDEASAIANIRALENVEGYVHRYHIHCLHPNFARSTRLWRDQTDYACLVEFDTEHLLTMEEAAVHRQQQNAVSRLHAVEERLKRTRATERQLAKELHNMLEWSRSNDSLATCLTAGHFPHVCMDPFDTKLFSARSNVVPKTSAWLDVKSVNWNDPTAFLKCHCDDATARLMLFRRHCMQPNKTSTHMLDHTLSPLFCLLQTIVPRQSIRVVELVVEYICPDYWADADSITVSFVERPTTHFCPTCRQNGKLTLVASASQIQKVEKKEFYGRRKTIARVMEKSRRFSVVRRSSNCTFSSSTDCSDSDAGPLRRLAQESDGSSLEYGTYMPRRSITAEYTESSDSEQDNWAKLSVSNDGAADLSTREGSEEEEEEEKEQGSKLHVGNLMAWFNGTSDLQAPSSTSSTDSSPSESDIEWGSERSGRRRSRIRRIPVTKVASSDDDDEYGGVPSSVKLIRQQPAVPNDILMQRAPHLVLPMCRLLVALDPKGPGHIKLQMIGHNSYVWEWHEHYDYYDPQERWFYAWHRPGHNLRRGPLSFSYVATRPSRWKKKETPGGGGGIPGGPDLDELEPLISTVQESVIGTVTKRQQTTVATHGDRVVYRAQDGHATINLLAPPPEPPGTNRPLFFKVASLAWEQPPRCTPTRMAQWFVENTAPFFDYSRAIALTLSYLGHAQMPLDTTQIDRTKWEITEIMRNRRVLVEGYLPKQATAVLPVNSTYWGGMRKKRTDYMTPTEFLEARPTLEHVPVAELAEETPTRKLVAVSCVYDPTASIPELYTYRKHVTSHEPKLCRDTSRDCAPGLHYFDSMPACFSLLGQPEVAARASSSALAARVYHPPTPPATIAALPGHTAAASLVGASPRRSADDMDALDLLFGSSSTLATTAAGLSVVPLTEIVDMKHANVGDADAKSILPIASASGLASNGSVVRRANATTPHSSATVTSFSTTGTATTPSTVARATAAPRAPRNNVTAAWTLSSFWDRVVKALQ